MREANTHHDDEGQVHADGEVCDGQHVGRRQLDEREGRDESHEVIPSPADQYHGRLGHQSKLVQQTTVVRKRARTAGSKM